MSDFGLDPDANSDFLENKKKRRKTKKVSPTQRSLKLLRGLGYTPWIVEHYNAYDKRRHDLYNFIDIVALHPKKQGILAVQTTTGSGLSSRIKKAEDLDNYHLWLACGNDVEFHGWRELKSGWEPMIIKVSYKDLF